MMTPRQIHLVQDSFAMLAPQAQHFTARFYARVFESDPSLRHLFPADLTEQRNKLAQVLGIAVGALERIDTLLPTLHQLGRRHAGYGVVARHYDTVGAALLATLAEYLGTAFTVEAKEAWTGVYVALARAMKDGARGDSPKDSGGDGTAEGARGAFEAGTRGHDVSSQEIHRWARLQRTRMLHIVTGRLLRRLRRLWRVLCRGLPAADEVDSRARHEPGQSRSSVLARRSATSTVR